MNVTKQPALELLSTSTVSSTVAGKEALHHD